ncbi:MAG: hypothetical protein LBH04_12090 [Tannerellaceae bacterium]|jgi:hypothetical protein|nr:hypothetical protein [Tannerellaceae bacterium]
MAADKRAVDFGKIKRYIRNRTAEFYADSLTGSEKEEFKSIIVYLDNVRRAKDLMPQYDMNEIERIKNLMTNFSPTREQFHIIQTINRQKREDNNRIRKVRKKLTPPTQPEQTKSTYEKISSVFWEMKTLMEEEWKNLSAKELEVVKKNVILFTKFIDTTIQERVKFEILQAQKQAEEIKAQIERLSSKIKVQ